MSATFDATEMLRAAKREPQSGVSSTPKTKMPRPSQGRGIESDALRNLRYEFAMRAAEAATESTR